MTLNEFLKIREERAANAPVLRQICRACLQPDYTCYCPWITPLETRIHFVILIHPIEMHRRIATGRMAHLTLKNSRLIMGQDYSENAELNALLADPSRQCVILYPGKLSTNFTALSREARFDFFAEDKTPTIIVIDGTWATARKMVRLSRNLHGLPRVCFTPSEPSNFRIRKQPRPECYSTIEAIHHTLELMGDGGRAHDALTFVFDKMVNRQLELAHCSEAKALSFKP